ncbi:MAG: hypothetical protein ACRC7C_07300 [Beijerinckiaceae bacterium]
MIRGDRLTDGTKGMSNQDPMRLRDLIPALRSQHGSASALLRRIDPAIADELRAYAAHRHVDLMDLAADCLEQLASDATDTLWQLGIERHGQFDDDPEAALLGSILRKTVLSRLRRERLVSSEVSVQTVIIGFSRSGHPYTMP